VYITKVFHRACPGTRLLLVGFDQGVPVAALRHFIVVGRVRLEWERYGLRLRQQEMDAPLAIAMATAACNGLRWEHAR
jgi:hypothetical protein